VTKVWALHGGGDWADASANYLVLPDGVDIAAEKQKWDEWYRKVYCGKRNTDNAIKYKTFYTWLVDLGTREPTVEELEIFSDE
jgi:hypothetical protein